MANPLIAKLGSFTDLSPEDLAQLYLLCETTRDYKAGQDLIGEGERPEDVFLLLEGWACRYKMLEDGSRQITAYLVPGDLCDVNVFILKEMDHSIGLLSNARVAVIPKQVMYELTRQRGTIAQALWWSTLVDEAVLRQWLVNMGQREAYQRIAHLFCELWVRLSRVGLTRAGEFTLPLTQEQLGDTVGLTAVHVNRVLQRMRGDGLISLTARHLTIHDSGRMMETAGFNASYLHLDRRG